MRSPSSDSGDAVSARMSVGTLTMSAVAVILGLACVSLAASGLSSGAPVLFVIGAVVTTVAYVSGLRPLVRAEPERLIIRNPWVTYGVSWPEVAGFQGGSRLLVRRRSDVDISVWAVQKTNLFVMLGREGRPERVAERLNDARARLQPDAADGVDFRRWAAPWVPLLLVVTVAVVSAL